MAIVIFKSVLFRSSEVHSFVIKLHKPPSDHFKNDLHIPPHLQDLRNFKVGVKENPVFFLQLDRYVFHYAKGLIFRGRRPGDK